MNEFAVDHWNAERVNELFEFFQQTGRFGGVVGVSVGPEQQGSLDHFWFFFDLKHL